MMYKIYSSIVMLCIWHVVYAQDTALHASNDLYNIVQAQHTVWDGSPHVATPDPRFLDISSFNHWQINPQDHSLRAVLSRWCNLAHWQLIWHVQGDYVLSTSWILHGRFESAVNQILRSTQHSPLPLFAKMYDSNKVIEIYSSSDNN